MFTLLALFNITVWLVVPIFDWVDNAIDGAVQDLCWTVLA